MATIDSTDPLGFFLSAILEWQTGHEGNLPDDISAADELEILANSLLKSLNVNPQSIESIPRHLIEYVGEHYEA